MAIPVAKSFGLTVITNWSGAGEERIKKLGADRFIDYRKEDYTEIFKETHLKTSLMCYSNLAG